MPDVIKVTRAVLPPIEEYIDEIAPMWESHWITNMGKKHAQLEKQLTEYLGVQRVSLMTNGHLALELALQAMKLKGEVITTPFTFASTTHAIVRNNLTPVFCDIEDDFYTIDTKKMESLVTDKTCAILPVHVYGNLCDVGEIERIARKYELKVLYDAAHAFGETYNGTGVGNYGDASVFSFHATKVFNTIEGGAVCFADEAFGKLLYHLKNFGISSEDVVDGVGANAKMSEFQAAMGICNLRHLDETLAGRRNVHERYMANLGNVKGLKLPQTQAGVLPNYAYFPILCDEAELGVSRNEIYNSLKKQGIYTRKYFYPLTSRFDCYHGKYDAYETPVALHVSKRVLTLPIYDTLALADVDRICKLILDMTA